MENKNKIYNKRLLKLADFLDKLPPERFDYGQWVGEDWKGNPDLSCGTAACALGWATTIPAFRKLGLYLDPESSEVYLKNKDGFDFEDIEASNIVFGLEVNEFFYLFASINYLYDADLKQYCSPNTFASAKDVAKHIRDFVTTFRDED